MGAPYTKVLGTSLSSFGVIIFFALSGYLVTESWRRQPQVLPFMGKRCRRIFPALIVCVLLAALVLGPLMTELSLYWYFHNANFWRYFGNLALYISYNLPGVFTGNPLPHAVNGSLWSLPVEFFCYLTVIALGFGSASKRALRVAVSSIAIMAAALWFSTYSGPQIVVYQTDLAAAASMAPYFFMGSLLSVLSNRVQLRMDAAVVLLTIMVALDLFGWPSRLLTYLALPYIVLAFSVQSWPVLRSWGRFGDFSYGMYLYSFPIQQTLVTLFRERLDVATLIAASTTLSLAAAALSWHLIEKRALRFSSFKVRVKNTAQA